MPEAIYSLSCSMPSFRKVVTRVFSSAPGTDPNNTEPLTEDSIDFGMPRTKHVRDLLKFPEAQEGEQSRVKDAPFFKEDDEQLIVIFGHSFIKEMETLKRASATAEAAGIKSEGGFGKDKKQTPSRLVFPHDKKDYSEIDRTLVGALALKWIITNDYEKFTKYQFEPIKLTRDSFQQIRELVMGEIRSPTDLYALMVSMIINDLGKEDKMLPVRAKKWRTGLLHRHKQAKPEQIKEKTEGNYTANHDEVIYKDAKEHKIELLEEFKGPLHDWLLLGLEMGAKLNVPQFAQAENVPGSLSSIKVMAGNQRALNFKIIEIILDVAGAQGHVDPRCAKSMLEPTWQSFATSRHLLEEIAAQKVTEREAYDKMLEARAALLEKSGFQKLSTGVPDERALLRLVTMGRALEAKGNASIIKSAFESLSPEHHEKLVSGLSVDGTIDGTAIIPYYAPSLFANIFRVAGKLNLEEQQRVAAISALLRFFVRVYHDTRPKPDCGKGLIVECNLGFVQNKVTGEDFMKNPGILDEVEIPAEKYSHHFDEWS